MSWLSRLLRTRHTKLLVDVQLYYGTTTNGEFLAREQRVLRIERVPPEALAALGLDRPRELSFVLGKWSVLLRVEVQL